jgi:hypothetical protein
MKWIKLFSVLLALLPFILISRPLSASHVNCNYEPIARNHGADHAVNGGASHGHAILEERFDAPDEIKNCIQSLLNSVPSPVIASVVWFDPITYSAPPTTEIRVGAVVANWALAVTDVSITYHDSFIKDNSGAEIPGTRGIVNLAGVGPDLLGIINGDESKGRSHRVTIDNSKLQLGSNRVCVTYSMSGTYSGIPIVPDSASPCTTLEYLPPASPTEFNNEPNVTATVTTVQPGDNLDLNLYVTNYGGGINPYPLTITAKNPDLAVFSPNCTPPSIAFAGGCRWNDITTPPDPSGGTTIGPYSYSFNVSASAPDGAVFCFNATVDPGAGESAPVPSISDPPPDHTDPFPPCITISRGRHPFIDTSGGNVHAGTDFGDNCLIFNGETGFSGFRNITGTTNGSSIGSKSQYILSSSGEVQSIGGLAWRQFGSSNSQSGNTLTFGNTTGLGNYGQICRPNLAGRLFDDPNTLPIDPGILGTLVGLGLPLINLIGPLPNDAVTKYSGDVALIGSPLGLPLFGGETISNGQRKTLIVDGNVFIIGDIKHSTTGYTSRRSIPSFALIATGNIYISPDVQQLYGIYYAGGDINTCNILGVNPPITIPFSANTCSLPLRINGSLFARKIIFRRTRGGVEPFASNVFAERVSLQPGLLLNPPPGLQTFVNQYILKGDLPPSY